MATTNVVNVVVHSFVADLLWFGGFCSILCLQVGHSLRFWCGFSCFVSFIWCQLFACLIRAVLFRLPPAFVVWSLILLFGVSCLLAWLGQSFFVCHQHLWFGLSLPQMKIFCLAFFLHEAGVFVNSCTSCFSFLLSVFTMSIRFFVCFFLPSSSPFSSAFITSSFLLSIFFSLSLLLISLSFSGGILVKEVFPFFSLNVCTGCQGVKMYFWVLSSVLVELARINLAKAGRCVKSSCPQGNWLGTISSSNLQGWLCYLRLLSFGKVWKENPLVVAFSSRSDWWWKRASFAIQLSVCLSCQRPTSRISRWPTCSTCFHGSDNLVDLKVMLCTRLS